MSSRDDHSNFNTGDSSELSLPSDKNDLVVILLATFNGESYLREQLDSILRQTHQNWKIFVSDDGSTDSTRVVIEDFAFHYPGRLVNLDLPPVSSAKENFLRLIRYAPKAQYYAFCDQDDYWFSNKIEKLLKSCQTLERSSGDNDQRPCLSYSDLQVVDQNLGLLSSSFMEQMNTKPSSARFGTLLVENHVPGCSMLFNRALVELHNSSTYSPEDVIMHDWLLVLLAKANGRICFISEPLMQYRQHETNSLGAVERRGVRIATAKLFKSKGKELKRAVDQASLILSTYGDYFPEHIKDILASFATIENNSKPRRVWVCLTRGILKQSLHRKIYQLLFI